MFYRGQTPADAEFSYLETAKRLEMYGVDLHSARGKGKDITTKPASIYLRPYLPHTQTASIYQRPYWHHHLTSVSLSASLILTSS